MDYQQSRKWRVYLTKEQIMAVLKGYIKPLVKSAKLPFDNDEDAESLIYDLCYDVVEKFKSKGLYFDESPEVRISVGDNYAEVELVVGGFSPREANANDEINTFNGELKKQLGKYLKGYFVGITKSRNGNINYLIMPTQKLVVSSGYEVQIQL